MIKILLRNVSLSIFISLLSNISFSQKDNIHWCGMDHVMEEFKNEHPERYQQIQEEDEKLSKLNVNDFSPRASYTIPIVFHIVHDNGIGNISDEQIEDAMRVLNEDFNYLNTDLSNLRAPFDTKAADMDITFKLARKDPNGNCTNGIVRLSSPSNTYDERGGDSDAKSASPAWTPNRYLNIWVVNSIYSSAGPDTKVLGYGQFPQQGVNSTYGIVIRHDEMGTIGTSISNGRTLTHEVGHNLGLYHTFQGNCGSLGDRVDDTPRTDGQIFNCDLNTNSCNDLEAAYGNVDVVDMIENYMGYNSCQWMFTTGQKNRVYSTISNYLSTMVSATNLSSSYTGVNEPEALCVADFKSDMLQACIGESIQFEDLSYFGATSWTWDFGPNATVSSSTAQNPTVSFSDYGIYDVTLTVSDGTTEKEVTKTDYIKVLPNGGKASPYSEGFESAYLNNNNWNSWTAYSDNNYGVNWEINEQASYSGSKSIYIENKDLSNGNSSYIISPPINLTNATDNVTLDLKYAFAGKSSSFNDKFQILISNDCGETWISRRTVSSFSIASADNTFGDFIPSDQSEWKELNNISITSAYWTDNLLVKIIFTSGGGNNFYIDDINITGDFGPAAEEPEIREDPTLNNGGPIDQIEESIKLFPNPAEDYTTLNILTGDSSDCEISIIDITGRTIKVLYNELLTPGNKSFDIYHHQVGSGIFFVTIKIDDKMTVKKLIMK